MATISRYTAYALFLSATLALSACGGSSTNIVEREPEEDHDHDHEHDHEEDEHSHGEIPSTKGRLVISAQDESEVMVYELDDGEELAHYPVANVVSSVYASPNHRFALILQRDGNQVNAVDGGYIRESHGDHFDYTIAAPSFSDFEVMGPRPTHFTLGADNAVIFYDGNADTSEVAEVGVISNADLANGGGEARIELTTHQHGAARTLGDHLFLTVRDPEDTSTTLPDRVAMYHLHDGEYELEQTFETPCPALHGSARWEHGVAFGCGDGVLVIHEETDGFEAHKIANPEGFSGRIGSLYALAEGHELIGVASGELYRVDPEAETIEALTWRDDERSAVGYAFDAEGAHFLILDNQGELTRLEVADEWTALERIDVVTSEVSDLPEGTSLSMAISYASHLVYVTDPVANTVIEVDLESGETETVLNLEATPAKLAWLGFAEAIEHEHEDHDH